MFNSEDVRVLQEAYASVYFDEAQHARENPEKYEDDEKRKMSKRQRAMNDPKTGINSPAFHEFMKQQMGGGKKKKVKEEVFNGILSHLLDEGYADDATSALAIMANMSEEWRDNIVELFGSSGATSKPQSQTQAKAKPTSTQPSIKKRVHTTFGTMGQMMQGM